jgi:Domain of unknown function (DUF4314)
MGLDRSLEGRRVKLVRCMDRYTNLPSGTLGTVVFTDAVGTLHVRWDNGSNLGLCPADGDRWEMVD